MHLCRKATKAFKFVGIADNIKVDDITARLKLFECALEWRLDAEYGVNALSLTTDSTVARWWTMQCRMLGNCAT